MWHHLRVLNGIMSMDCSVLGACVININPTTKKGADYISRRDAAQASLCGDAIEPAMEHTFNHLGETYRVQVEHDGSIHAWRQSCNGSGSWGKCELTKWEGDISSMGMEQLHAFKENGSGRRNLMVCREKNYDDLFLEMRVERPGIKTKSAWWCVD